MMHDVSSPFLFLVVLFGTVGIGILIVALRLARLDLRRIPAGHVAEARLIALIPVDSADGVTFRTQVEFHDRTARGTR
jgi:hypothetical protein